MIIPLSLYVYIGLSLVIATVCIWDLVRLIVNLQPSSAVCMLDDVKEEYKPGFLNEAERTKVIFKVSVPLYPSIPVTKFVAYRRLDNSTRDVIRARFRKGTSHKCKIIKRTRAISSIDDVRTCIPDEYHRDKLVCFRREFKNKKRGTQYCMLALDVLTALAAVGFAIRMILTELGYYGKHDKKIDKEDNESDDEDDSSPISEIQ